MQAADGAGAKSHTLGVGHIESRIALRRQAEAAAPSHGRGTLGSGPLSSPLVALHLDG